MMISFRLISLRYLQNSYTVNCGWADLRYSITLFPLSWHPSKESLVSSAISYLWASCFHPPASGTFFWSSFSTLSWICRLSRNTSVRYLNPKAQKKKLREQFVVCLRDRAKNGASKRAGRGCRRKEKEESFRFFPYPLSFFERPKPKIPFFVVPRSFFAPKPRGNACYAD